MKCINYIKISSFLDNLDSINKEDYVPSPKDLIMSYVPTVGVQNVIFTCDNRAFQ